MATGLNRQQENYLEELYSDPAHPASFQGPETVYRAVQREGRFPRITYANIRQWVQNKEAYSKNRKISKQFQRNRVIVSGIDDQWDADLASFYSFEQENDGFNYLLCVIDIFSRFAWVKLLKNKKAPTVVQAFEQILEESGRKPDRLRTDSAQDFKSRLFQQMCSDRGIRSFFMAGEKQANYIERFIQTLKSRIFKYMIQNNQPRYIDILNEIVESYNYRFHTGIQMEPAYVNKDNEKRLWWQMYLPEGFYQPHSFPKPKPLKFKFQIDDHVRISYTVSGFNRHYDQKWSTEVFIVHKRFGRYGIPVYVLKDTLGNVHTGTFYESEMQKIQFNPDQAFNVDKILKRRRGARGRREVLVRWLDWPKKYDSWEPEANIQDIH
jgi:hypothetical protein